MSIRGLEGPFLRHPSLRLGEVAMLLTVGVDYWG